MTDQSSSDENPEEQRREYPPLTESGDIDWDALMTLDMSGSSARKAMRDAAHRRQADERGASDQSG